MAVGARFRRVVLTVVAALLLLASLNVADGVGAQASTVATPGASHGPESHAAGLAARRALVRQRTSVAGEQAASAAIAKRTAAALRKLSPAKRKAVGERDTRAVQEAGRPGTRPATNPPRAAGTAATPDYVQNPVFFDNEWATGPAGEVAGNCANGFGIFPEPCVSMWGDVFVGEVLTLQLADVYTTDRSGDQISVAPYFLCEGLVTQGPAQTVDVPWNGNPGPGTTVSATATVPDSCQAASSETVINLGFVLVVNGNSYSYAVDAYSVTPAPAGQNIACPASPDSAGAAPTQGSCGDPVDTATGAYGESVTDAALPAPGYPLVISRSYSSANSAAGSLGTGWSLPWEAHLSINSSSGDATFTAENGDQYLYPSDGFGGFSTPAGARSVLAEVPNSAGKVTGYTLTTPQNDVLSFNTSGRLTSEVDPARRGLKFAYGSSGPVSSITDASGQQVALTYSGGLLAEVTLPDGKDVAYGYTNKLLTSVTTPSGSASVTTHYTYTPGGLLASVTDPDGNTATNTYNSAGQVTQQQNGAGQVTTFSYTTTSDGLDEADVTDPNGGITTHLYAAGMLMQVTDQLGHATSDAYNGAGQLVAVTDPLGNVTSMTYDGNGNLLSETDPLGNEQSWTYDGSNNVLSASDTDFNTTNWTYNSMDEPLTRTDPSGDEATYGYDSSGNLTAETDPRGNVSGANAAQYTTTYAYNSAAELLSMTNPGGNATRYTYNAMGMPLTVTDPEGNVTAYSYDGADRVVSVTVPGGSSGHVTNYAYDPDGNLTARTDPDGNRWSYSYNADDQLAGQIDPLGNSISYSYDGDGNEVRFTDARGITTNTAYDADNRPTQISYSDATPSVSYAYDADGDATSITDGTGTRALGYDPDGELTSDGGFSYTYDPDGNVASRTYPDGTQVSYGFNANEQVSSVTTGSAPTSYGYDPAGDLISVAQPNGVTQTRTYNGADQLTGTAAATPGGTMDSDQLTLTADGQPSVVAVTQNGKAQPSQYYSYNSTGNLTSACYSATGTSACSAASAGAATGSGGGLAVTAGANSATVSWTPASGVTGYTVTASPGGQTAVAGPYAASATVSGLTAGTAYSFTVTATTASGTTVLGPTTAVTPSNETTYSYDAAGNLTGTQTDGATTTNSYNADEELTQSVAGGTTTGYGYDADGDQTSAGGTTYAYNGAGDLTAASTPAGKFTYSYDAGGNLAATSLDGTQVQGTVWDLNSPLPTAAEDTGPDGATTADYSYLPNGTLSSVATPAGAYSPISDWLGSVTGLTDAAGTQVTSTTYGPYGNPSTTDLASGAPAQSIGYAGSYQLPGGGGLDDMRARDYNPGTGGFTTVDPLLSESDQPYLYGNDDPAYFTDPAGQLFGLDNLVAGGIGALVAAGGTVLNDELYGTPVNWANVGMAAASGFVVGALADECGLCASPVLGAVTGAANSIISQEYSTGSVNWVSVAAQAGAGGVMGSLDDFMGSGGGEHVAQTAGEAFKAGLWTSPQDLIAGGMDIGGFWNDMAAAQCQRENPAHAGTFIPTG